MKKIFIIILFFLTGCSNTILTCSKTNYSTIYGSEIYNDVYTFKNNKLIIFSSIKKIIFDENMNKYIEDVYSFKEKELNIISNNIKGTKTNIIKNNSNILINITVDITSTDSTISKLNIDKNVSIDYLKNNNIEKGYYCETEN